MNLATRAAHIIAGKTRTSQPRDHTKHDLFQLWAHTCACLWRTGTQRHRVTRGMLADCGGATARVQSTIGAPRCKYGPCRGAKCARVAEMATRQCGALATLDIPLQV